MRFRLTLREVEEADTGSTTYYGGYLLVNGQQYGMPDGANDRGNYLDEALERAVVHQLGRELTDDEVRAVYSAIAPLDAEDEVVEDERLYPGDPRERVIEVGDEPGGGEDNPAPEWVTWTIRPEWARLIRALYGIAGDDAPEDWVDRGFDPADVRALGEFLGEG